MADQIATKTIRRNDGRMLAYVEVGKADGPLVIHNHGGPSSRLEARLFADAAANIGLRFVGVDRPGIGQSSAQPARSYEGWADDMTRIADALGYTEFGVTGWSEGGPWALAAAAYIDPRRLKHVTSIAGGSYRAFGDNWAARSRRPMHSGVFLQCISSRAFASCMRPSAFQPSIFARASSKNCLKPQTPMIGTCYISPDLKRAFAPPLQNASRKAATA